MRNARARHSSFKPQRRSSIEDSRAKRINWENANENEDESQTTTDRALTPPLPL